MPEEPLSGKDVAALKFLAERLAQHAITDKGKWVLGRMRALAEQHGGEPWQYIRTAAEEARDLFPGGPEVPDA